MATFKWVHLSDLHMQENDSFDRSRVLEALFEDIKDREKTDPQLKEIDAVFFTGDMAYHGYESEYDLAHTEFIKPLLEVINIQINRFFLVPGNHDIDITRYQRYATKWGEDLKKAEDVRKFLEAKDEQELVQQRMSSYLKYYAKLTSGSDLRLPGWFNTAEIKVDSKKVIIICLNTAWMCTGDEKDRPCLGERQLVEALRSANESDLTIALFHHPIGKWSDIDDTTRCDFELQTKCGLWFQGHLHKPDVRGVMSPSGNWVQISAGAIFNDRNSPLSYNYGVLDLETGEGVVYIRKYYKNRNEWATDIEATGKKYDGKIPIEVKSLNKKIAEVESVDITCEPTDASGLPLSLNPFSIVAAESMNVEEVTRLFVGTHTKLDTAQKRFGTIIEGQRGTGKSMILKYLSFPVQIKIWQNKGLKGDSYFREKHFIGVYCKLQQGVFDKPDLDKIEGSAKREHIFEHRITSVVCFHILETMKEVIVNLGLKQENIDLLTNRLLRIIEAPQQWIESAENLIQILDVYRDLFRKKAREVDEFLRNPAESSFVPKFTLSGTMYDLLELFQEELNIKECCFFLLLDDFDVLHDWQQEIIFSVAAQRHFDLVCFKFGVMSEGIKTGLSGSHRTFRPGDDYDPISLDMVERGMLRNDYPDAVAFITAKRLQASGWASFFGKELPDPGMELEFIEELKQATNELMNNIFPVWKYGHKLKKDLKNNMNAEWEDAKDKPTQKKPDFFSKYGNARYFQTLRKKKQPERFAGYEYITAISSGIVRQYLEICSQIVSEAYKERWSPQQGNGIPPEVQNRAIRDYSEAFFKNLNKGAGAHGTFDELGEGITSEEVTELIESLSDLFYERLHYPGHGEPEIITFSLKDSNPFVDNLLNICVRESVLQKFSYPPKTAGKGHFRAYILNRRLIPRRSLSALRMQGRIEMDSDDIKLAISNMQKFVKKFMPDDSDKNKKSMQKQFPDMMEDDQRNE